MWQLLFAHVLAASPEPVPWARSVEGDVVRLAIVGSLPDVADPWADAVRGAEPDLVLFTGVDRDDVLTGWPSDHGVLAMAAGVPTKAYLARFPGIGGDLPNATPYGWVDLVVGGIRWRVVYVTAADRPIARWEEQLWWLPRALERSAYDRLIVVSDAPRHTLSDRDPSPGARMLLDAVQEAADPMAFALFVAGNTGTNEVFTPGGRFGELHLVAGASGGRREGHHREGQGMPGVQGRERLEPSWQAALVRDQGDRPWFQSPVGFWTLELQAERAELVFHEHGEAGWTPGWRLVRGPAGWSETR